MTARSSVHTFAIRNEPGSVGVFVAVIFLTLAVSAHNVGRYVAPPDLEWTCFCSRFTFA